MAFSMFLMYISLVQVITKILLLLNMFRIQKILRWASTASKPTNPQKIPTPQRKSKGKLKFRRIALISLTIFLSLMIYSKTRKNEIQFLMLNSQLNRLFIKNNKELNKQLFLPTLYLPLGLLQMLWSKYFQSRRYIKHRKQQLQGYTVYYMPKSITQQKIEEQNKSKVLTQGVGAAGKLQKIDCVIVVAGSEGFNQLMTNIMVLAHSNKFQVVGVDVDDLHNQEKLIKIINKIKGERNNQKVYGVGIQYGANLMALSCAKQPKLFDGIVSLGNPFDLEKAERQVQESFAAKWTFLNNMRNGRISRSPKSKTQIPQSTTFSTLSSLLYSLNPTSMTDFNRKNSSINCLNLLKIPSLFLNSKQDPFSIQFQQQEQLLNNPLLMFILTKHGGHNQWFYSLTPTRWAARLTVSHLKNLNKILKENPGIVQAELNNFEKQQQIQKQGKK